MDGDAALRVLLVGEGDLSHAALIHRLDAALAAAPGVETELRLIAEPGRWEALAVRRIEALSHADLQPLRWRLRYSARARGLLNAPADVALVNTQACALLAAAPMRRRPTVLSVDATHAQFARLEYWRPRTRGARAAEIPIDVLERRAYRSAARILAWTEWTARSVREDYGIAAERVATVHPGVPLPPAPPARDDRGGPLRVLFIGNGVRRKGLGALLEAADAAAADIHVDVLSGDPEIDSADPRLTLHRGVVAGDERHRELLARAHLLALPTLADAAPWVVVEALAAGLPVVATRVGAIPELVGDAGLLTGPGEVRELAAALEALAGDAARRTALAAAARRRAEERYDAARQTPRILEVLRASHYPPARP